MDKDPCFQICSCYPGVEEFDLERKIKSGACVFCPIVMEDSSSVWMKMFMIMSSIDGNIKVEQFDAYCVGLRREIQRFGGSSI